MQVRLGPISAAFAGTATHERDAAARIGILAGGGADQRGNSRVRGRVTYRLVPEHGRQATRVAVTPGFLLQGVLAQFSPAGLVQDPVRPMGPGFAVNPAATLSCRPSPLYP